MKTHICLLLLAQAISSVTSLKVCDATCVGIINNHFGNLSDYKGLPLRDLSPAQLPAKTFDQCLLINSNKYPFRNRTYSYDLTIDFVNLNLKNDNVNCDGNDLPPCKAIYAAKNAFLELEEKGYYPKFNNYLAAFSNGYMNTTSCEPNSYDLVNTKFVPGKENGCNGFGFCDMITSITFFGANQRNTGTCGPTAMFMALAKANPPKAIQLATELMWTGTLTLFQAKNAEPCEYIYALNPGTVKAPSLDSTLEQVCGEKPNNDCKNYYNGLQDAKVKNMAPFVQSPGMEYIMTQSFGSSYFKYQTGCCTPEGFQLIKSDFSNHDTVSGYQSSYPAAMLYWCELLIDKSLQECNPGFYMGPAPGLDKMTPEAKNYWYSGVWRNPTSDNQIAGYFGGIASKASMTCNAKTWVDGATCDVDPTSGTTSWNETTRQTAALYLNNMLLVPAFPVTNFETLCNLVANAGQAVTLVVDSSVFAATGPGPNNARCNHYVMLNSCDLNKQEAYIWTWGELRTVKADALVNRVCSAVGAYYAPNSSSKPSFFDYKPSSNCKLEDWPTKQCSCEVASIAASITSPIYALFVAFIILCISF